MDNQIPKKVLKSHVSKDYVHIIVSPPPYLSVSKMVQLIKGKISNKLQQEIMSIQKRFWGRHVWTRGYFVASSGNVTDEVIMKYIENQDVEKEDEDFKIGD